MEDVIIVGAGLSGLATARALTQRRVSVRLLEGRDRPGGRVLSTEAGVDLGPSWIWPGQNRVLALTSALGLEVFPQPTAGDLVFDRGSGQVQRGKFDAHGGAHRTRGGVATWIEALVDLLPDAVLKLGHVVRELKDGAEGVRVTVDTSEGTTHFHARQVVLALPPRVMLNIRRTPDWTPGEAAGLARISTWMASEAKLVATYSEPFWRSAGLSGDAFSPGVLGQVWDATTASGEAALGAFVRLDAEARQRLGVERLKEAGVAQLAELFGPGARRPKEVQIHDWYTESLTATGADAQRPAGHPDYRPPFAPVLWDGRLILSGTELAPDAGGYLEGALASSEATIAAIRAPEARP